MIRDRQKLLADQRTRRPGAKTGQHIIQIGGAPGTAVTTTLAVIKYDGERDGKRYTGHTRQDDGSLGDAVQFLFPNDSGDDDLLDADDHVLAIECPEWDANNACWSGDDDKYWAILSPWAAMG